MKSRSRKECTLHAATIYCLQSLQSGMNHSLMEWEVASMSSQEIQEELGLMGVSTEGCLDASDFVAKLLDARVANRKCGPVFYRQASTSQACPGRIGPVWDGAMACVPAPYHPAPPTHPLPLLRLAPPPPLLLSTSGSGGSCGRSATSFLPACTKTIIWI